MNRILLLALVIGVLCSCQPKSPGGDQAENTTNQPAQVTEQAPASTTPAASAVQYPSVPLDTLMMLWENCDYIDFVFYNFNFSMSQHEKEGIQSTLRHIAEETPTIVDDCPAIGRLFFQVDGRNALEGDIHIGPHCLYYIFYENGKKAYANKMTEMGKNFYASIFQQMLKSTESQTQ